MVESSDTTGLYQAGQHDPGGVAACTRCDPSGIDWLDCPLVPVVIYRNVHATNFVTNTETDSCVIKSHLFAPAPAPGFVLDSFPCLERLLV